MSGPAVIMFAPAATEMAKGLGLALGRPNLEEFAASLEALAKANGRIVAVTSDSRGSGKLTGFGKALPQQLVEVGIAKTIKGRGVSFMEHVGKWHHGVPSDTELKTALAEIDEALRAIEGGKE